jgi:hypothetical protein
MFRFPLGATPHSKSNEKLVYYLEGREGLLSAATTELRNAKSDSDNLVQELLILVSAWLVIVQNGRP